MCVKIHQFDDCNKTGKNDDAAKNDIFGIMESLSMNLIGNCIKIDI